GIKFNDLTGNGFSPDDTRLGGVTINLFRDINNNGTLDAGDGPPIATTTTAMDGTFSFNNLGPGTYFVEEIAPANSTQTGGPPFYTINARSGQNVTNQNFANHFTSMIIGKVDLLGSNFVDSSDGNIEENVAFINSIYHNVLSRAPDQGGLNNWFLFLEAGVPRFEVVQDIWISPEHRNLEVEQLYETVLHRNASPAERVGWVAAVLSGEDEAQIEYAF